MKFLEAVLILSGMIIGVGMFGIPFSFVRAGFVLGALELLLLSGVVLMFHLLYGEVVLKTPAFHRLPGYVALYLGPRAALISWASALFGISGTLLVYLVLGTLFLKNLALRTAGASSEFLLVALIVIFGAAVTFFPPKKEALVNGILTGLLILFIISLSVLLIPQVQTENLYGFHPKNVFVPYGILLFALSGGVVIPDLITLLGRERRKSLSAITAGSLIPSAVYFIFALAVVGVTGGNTSEEAIQGLGRVLGSWMVLVGSAIGFLAVFTSYIVLSSSFQALLRLDFRAPKYAAWAVASLIPVFLYFLGFQNFILIIGAVGAIAVGIDSLLILVMHYRLRKAEGVAMSFFSYAWRAGIFAVIAAGVLYESVVLSF